MSSPAVRGSSGRGGRGTASWGRGGRGAGRGGSFSGGGAPHRGGRGGGVGPRQDQEPAADPFVVYGRDRGVRGGRGRGRGGRGGRGRVSSKSSGGDEAGLRGADGALLPSLTSLRKKIRDVTRMLNRKDAPPAPEICVSLEAKLKALEDQVVEVKKAAKWEERALRWEHRYRNVKFIEKKKLLRMRKQLVHQLATLLAPAGVVTDEEKALRGRLQQVETDLHYIENFPRGVKYVGFFGEGSDAPKEVKVREKIRATIAASEGSSETDETRARRFRELASDQFFAEGSDSSDEEDEEDEEEEEEEEEEERGEEQTGQKRHRSELQNGVDDHEGPDRKKRDKKGAAAVVDSHDGPGKRKSDNRHDVPPAKRGKVTNDRDKGERAREE